MSSKRRIGVGKKPRELTPQLARKLQTSTFKVRRAAGRPKRLGSQSSLRWRASEAGGESSCVITFVCPRLSWLVRLALQGALLAPIVGYSEMYVVDSLADLATRIKTAAPGDVVTVKNGVYTANAPILVECAGTLEQPITIAAETIGGVEITGTHGLDIEEPAAHVVIVGFKFTHASGKNSIGIGTRFVRLTRNVFACVGDGHFLSVNGDDVQLDFNEFGPKTSPGTMLAVSGTGSQVARRLWIHHNYFHDFANDGSNGAEMIRFGLLSAHRLSVGSGLVEHNLFVRCRGTNEMISNRSSGNTYRFNTFQESPTSHLTIRQGNECAIYGNIFRQTEGLRFFGDRHRIYSNYFEGNYIAVSIGNGDLEISEAVAEVPPNSRDRPDGCSVVFNTFVDNTTHLRMSKGAPGALGATGIIFANNLLYGGDVAAKIDGPNVGAVWSGNVLWKTNKPRDLPVNGYAVLDPLFESDGRGIKRPLSGSPIAGAATGGFSFVTVDVDGQTRPEKASVGADELSDGPVIAGLLSSSDVGPQAGQPLDKTKVEKNGEAVRADMPSETGGEAGPRAAEPSVP